MRHFNWLAVTVDTTGALALVGALYPTREDALAALQQALQSAVDAGSAPARAGLVPVAIEPVSIPDPTPAPAPAPDPTPAPNQDATTSTNEAN